MLVGYLWKACLGKLVWEKIKKKYGQGYHPERYLLFPSKDDEYNAWALYYMEAYIKEFRLGKVKILSANHELLTACADVNHRDVLPILLSEKEMECLLRFCALVNLSGELTIVSVREPYDTGAERMLGKKGTTKRELVWYDIYRMSKPPCDDNGADIRHWKNADRYLQYLANPGN